MFDEQACEKALENLRILERKDNFKKWGGQVAPQVNCDVVEQLIKDRFESKEETLEFKNFKLHADGTLKSMSKDELISYIHMLHHNWNVSDEQLFNVIEMNNKLQDKLVAIKNPQPYKFEDLKVGMWMWDDEERECRKILETYVTGEDNDVYVKGVRIVRHGLHEFNWKYSVFKEGRFFPIIKALEYQK